MGEYIVYFSAFAGCWLVFGVTHLLKRVFWGKGNTRQEAIDDMVNGEGKVIKDWHEKVLTVLAGSGIIGHITGDYTVFFLACIGMFVACGLTNRKRVLVGKGETPEDAVTNLMENEGKNIKWSKKQELWSDKD